MLSTYFLCHETSVSPVSRSSWLQWFQNQCFPWPARTTTAASPRSRDSGLGLLFPLVSRKLGFTLIEGGLSCHIISETIQLQVISPLSFTKCPVIRRHCFGGDPHRMLYVCLSVSSIASNVLLFLFSLLSHVWLWDSMNYSLPGSSVHGDSPGKNTGMCGHFLLQGILLTPGLNACSLHLR